MVPGPGSFIPYTVDIRLLTTFHVRSVFQILFFGIFRIHMGRIQISCNTCKQIYIYIDTPSYLKTIIRLSLSNATAATPPSTFSFIEYSLLAKYMHPALLYPYHSKEYSIRIHAPANFYIFLDTSVHLSTVPD